MSKQSLANSHGALFLFRSKSVFEGRSTKIKFRHLSDMPTLRPGWNAIGGHKRVSRSLCAENLVRVCDKMGCGFDAQQKEA
jgi:hypothetical protein